MNAEQLDALSETIREIFKGPSTISVMRQSDGSLSVSIHDLPSYQAGTELMRRLGFEDRQKVVFENEGSYTTSISGKSGKHEIGCFCNTLPPTCRLETVTEKIPKQLTVDTGEFIEVQRTKVVCGENHE